MLSLFDRVSAVPCSREYSRHHEFRDDGEDFHHGHQGSGSGSNSQTLGEEWYSSSTQTSMSLSTPTTIITSEGSSTLASSTSTTASTFHNGDFHRGYSSRIIGAAVGGAVGGVAGLLLIAGGAMYMWRRRKQRNKRVFNQGGWSVIVTDGEDAVSRRNTAYVRDEDAGPLDSPMREVHPTPLPPSYNPNWQVNTPDTMDQNRPETGRARELLVDPARVPPRRSSLDLKPRFTSTPNLT